MHKVTFKIFVQQPGDSFFVSYETFVAFLGKELLPYRVELKSDKLEDSDSLKQRLKSVKQDSQLYQDLIFLNKDSLMFEIYPEEIFEALKKDSAVFKLTVEYA